MNNYQIIIKSLANFGELLHSHANEWELKTYATRNSCN